MEALTSEEGSEADLELRRLNVAEVPTADSRVRGDVRPYRASGTDPHWALVARATLLGAHDLSVLIDFLLFGATLAGVALMGYGPPTGRPRRAAEFTDDENKKVRTAQDAECQEVETSRDPRTTMACGDWWCRW